MEQQSYLYGTSENLPYLCTDTFPSCASIEHSAECIGTHCENEVHIVECKFCSPDSSGGYDVNGMAYSDGTDVTRNMVNENFVDENVYLLPYEQYISSETNYCEYVPFEEFNYCYIENVYQYEWHQEDFYNGANIETLYPQQYSYGLTNYTSYFRGGTMYFVPHQNISNGINTGHVTYAQSQPGFADIGIQHPEVAHVEANFTSCTENSRFDATNVASHQEATKAETPRRDAASAEPRLEDTNAEISNVDDANTVKTPPGTTEDETIVEKDLSELGDTLSECLISDSSNAEFQPDTSNSNSQCIGKETNYDSLNSNNLGDGQNIEDRNSCEHVDSENGKNVSEQVEKDGNKGQMCLNRNVSSNANRRNKRENSRQVSGNNLRRGDTGIYYKNFNSRRNGRSSSDYDSLNTKHLNDRNGSNGSENADSRQGSRRKNGNSDVARCRDFQSSKGYDVHCDNELYGTSLENCKISGASYGASKSNFSYSAAVKRSLNSVR